MAKLLDTRGWTHILGSARVGLKVYTTHDETGHQERTMHITERFRNTRKPLSPEPPFVLFACPSDQIHFFRAGDTRGIVSVWSTESAGGADTG